ncbi:MAG TPA: VOC family protein [Myxococcaceae bacterium]|nr:VOC family protein [Myxococcaceae bacterium]
MDPESRHVAACLRMSLRLRPKLVVSDASSAIAFYEAVFGARVKKRFTMGDTTVFAELSLPSGDVLQLKDADATDPAPGASASGVILDVLCEDPDAVAEAALARGAEIVFPIRDQPYGSRQGRIRDPFGHQWIVGGNSTMSDEEVQAALDAWASSSGRS